VNILRIFQRFRQVKFDKKFQTRLKNLKIEKIIAFTRADFRILFLQLEILISYVCYGWILYILWFQSQLLYNPEAIPFGNLHTKHFLCRIKKWFLKITLSKSP